MLAFSFHAPSRLWLLVLPVLLLVAYVVSQIRRRGYVVKFTNVDLLKSVAPKRPRWRRHLPAFGLLLGLAALSLSLAKPAVAQEVPEKRGVVMLAIDTSLSMKATDVAPTRLAAAQNAARAFLAKVPKGVKVGLVGFDGQASLLVPPTDQVTAVEQGINNLQLGEGTAIGEAVFTSLDALDQALQVTPASASGADSTGSAGSSGSSDSSTTNKNNAGAIVLMSDGETTMGRSNDQAAAQATKEGRPVYTIAVGTDSGTVTLPDGSSQAVPVNRDALQQLAEDTGGHYFPAYTSTELKQVYQDLGRKLTHEHRNKDVSGWFAGGAMGLLALAAVGSLLWFARLP
jgi:Ca-activated chloride channel family protein